MLGYQLIAISPDRPEKLRKTLEKHHMKYTLLSDSKMAAAKAMGIAFKLDAAAYAKYREYGIDLQEASGEGPGLLSVPAVFIIGKDGGIKYEYINPDYKVRLKAGILLSAAEDLIKDK